MFELELSAPSRPRTAYYAEDTGAPRLPLTVDGDPNGKTVDGDEAG